MADVEPSQWHGVLRQDNKTKFFGREEIVYTFLLLLTKGQHSTLERSIFLNCKLFRSLKEMDPCQT